MDDAVNGILLIGCGRMGSAMARAWTATERVYVYDPQAGDVAATVRIERLTPEALPMPLTVVVAVKPQLLDEVLPQVAPFAHAGCLIVSVVAGATLARFAKALGVDAKVVRTMPNTPAAI